jgi:hypothetical protein
MWCGGDMEIKGKYMKEIKSLLQVRGKHFSMDKKPEKLYNCNSGNPLTNSLSGG